jgi:hypothetical protein
MSLVIAFIGSQGAVMAGDLREILFLGDASCRAALEAELYDGRIVTEDHLQCRAGEIGIAIHVRDTKSKVSERDGILVGEVGETEAGIVRKRRLYASQGQYVLADFTPEGMTLVSKGSGSTFIVLGNEVAKAIANRCIRESWKGGGLAEAIRTIIFTMQVAARTTASVSREYVLVQTRQRRDVFDALERDAEAAAAGRGGDDGSCRG